MERFDDQDRTECDGNRRLINTRVEMLNGRQTWCCTQSQLGDTKTIRKNQRERYEGPLTRSMCAIVTVSG